MKFNLLLLLVLVTQITSAQQLKFNAAGMFKIIQFTDVHYIEGARGSKSSLDMINETLDSEKPDLVVFTGDIVVGHKQVDKSWDTVLETVIARKIPYLVTFGNHDDEGDWNRQQVADYIASKPLLLNKGGYNDSQDGFLNSAITIKDKNNADAAILYIMDSHAYSTIPKVKGYGWFTASQIDWYKKQSNSFKNTNNKTLPALAFFHIALPEYSIAFNDMRNKRIGVRYEAECHPAINTGMFAAMLEQGDIIGTFVGHDHVNDYLVDYYGIALAYGCFSGSSNTYQRTKNGARVILLEEGKRSFYTYIRERGGQISYKTSYPFGE